ncbi:MAG: ribosome assembly RNA-binding protein YhbY [Candidatus Marinimicrobia bacterium]|nr:ribosome assembly RNA-binding protein YhbY [Candidatus Neomarinimicrobiota bacterium]MCF7850129.1 ribosome assembly RNA-binding protein YhbY [Candidatus Neomarinimicrobiota bacterium]MCF7905092.1 ribosome assembly RNA-binding protein YhbY [Candidatus Neomarinimicrobiota bacterium]
MLTAKERKFLKANANHLKPVVLIGKMGVTEESVQSIVSALDHHELIKIKFIAFKTEKKELSESISKKTDSELVGLIGNVLILYRMNEDPEKRRLKLPD